MNAMDSNDRRVSHRAELEKRIAEVSKTLEQLRLELQQETEREQHREIDRLEQYLEDAHVKLSSVRSFWRAVVSEWRRIG